MSMVYPSFKLKKKKNLSNSGAVTTCHWNYSGRDWVILRDVVQGITQMLRHWISDF